MKGAAVKGEAGPLGRVVGRQVRRIDMLALLKAPLFIHLPIPSF